MSAPYPVLHCPDLAAKQAAVRALYGLGFRRYGHQNVEVGVDAINLSPSADCLRLIASVNGSNIGFDPKTYSVTRGTLVNSLPHMLSYIRHMGIKP